MAKSRIGPILSILVLLVIVYFIYMYYVRPVHIASPLKIGIPEARSRRFGLIIDVRTPKERELLGYYPNSIPIGLHQLQQQVPLDISSKDTWILVYCGTGARARKAAELLYSMGYKNTRFIDKSYLSLMPGSS